MFGTVSIKAVPRVIKVCSIVLNRILTCLCWMCLRAAMVAVAMARATLQSPRHHLRRHSPANAAYQERTVQEQRHLVEPQLQGSTLLLQGKHHLEGNTSLLWLLKRR